MIARLVVTLAVSIFVVMQAAAQNLGFGPQVGIYKAQDADNARVMGGAALRLRLSDALGLEGSINYREEAYSNGSVNVKTWPVMVKCSLFRVTSLPGWKKQFSSVPML